MQNLICDHCGKQITYSDRPMTGGYSLNPIYFCSYECWVAPQTKAQQERRDFEQDQRDSYADDRRQHLSDFI